MTSISEIKKIRTPARTLNYEPEQHNAPKPRPTRPRHERHQPHDMLLPAQKKRKKIKEKSIQKVGQKIPESVLYYFRA